MSAQHTPGPWIVEHWHRGESQVVALVGQKKSLICAGVLTPDAHLIAGSKDLLAASIDSLNLVNDLIAGIGVSDDRLQIERDRLEAAISKAEGRA